MKSYTITFPKEAMTTHLLMTPLGGSQYRLEETPVFLEDELSFHDVIRAKRRLRGGLQFQHLVDKSGLRVYEFVLSQEFAVSERLQVLLRRVEDEGGHWERVFGGILFIHLPVDASMKPNEEVCLP